MANFMGTNADVTTALPFPQAVTRFWDGAAVSSYHRRGSGAPLARGTESAN